VQENQVNDILFKSARALSVKAITINRTPALTNTLAAIAMFLFLTCIVHAIRKDIVTTREKQNPITNACGINFFFDRLKKYTA
jgi:hypothetical protein